MAGMERFGLDWMPCVNSAGVAIRIADCDSIAWVAGGVTSASFTFTLSATFGGSYTAPAGWAPIVHYYTDSSNGVGTAIWSDKVANNAAGDAYHGSGSNVVPYTGTITTGTGVLITLLASQVPIALPYVKCTVSAGSATYLVAITTPVVQRRSNLMPALSA